MASPIGNRPWPRLRERLVATAAAAALLSSPRPAIAEGSALAQSLFDRARVLMDEGKFAEACPLLVESQRLDPGGGTLLNIAVCWENAGRLATANAAFHDALGQAIKDQRGDRKKIAEERLAALAPRLPMLVVEVPPAARVPGLQVHVDGTELSQVAWGVPAAVDGGEHRIDAAAPGHQSWSFVITTPNEGGQGRVKVPPLPPLEASGPHAPLAGARRDDRVCPPGMRVDGDTCTRLEPPAQRFSTATWITGGIGIGLVGLGAIAGGVALAKDGDAQDAAADAGCNRARDFCPTGAELDAAQADADGAATWGWVSTGAITTGAAAILIALVLPREVDKEAARPVAFIAPGTLGIGVRAPVSF